MASSRQILARIRKIGPVVHGSVVKTKITCGKEGCKCARGEPHSAFYLSRRVQGKTRMEHISRGHVDTVRQWRKNYDRLMGLVEELTTTLVRELREGGK